MQQKSQKHLELPKYNATDPSKKSKTSLPSDTTDIFTSEEHTKHQISNIISISTHNVRGINRTIDQDMLIKEMEMRQINILGISETKISDSKLHFAFQDHRK